MKPSDLDHNPYLKPWVKPHPNRVAGKGAIDRPGEVPNIVWQTRTNAPTEYENQFGDALEQVFEKGAASLEEVTAGLNALGFRTPDGQSWTGERFQEEVKRLAAK